MRFAAIADVHGNHLALEAVVAEIRAEGIDAIVNLGDMASSPLEARRTMDALMALDAVHVLGNHDRWLIDRPPEKMGSWDRPAYAQLEEKHLAWLRTIPPTRIFRDLVFLCHGTPGNDDLYWLETVTSDGSVTLSTLEAIEKEAKGISQSLILCAHTHIARAVRLSDGRMVVNPGSVGVPGFSYNVPYPHLIEAGTPDARYAILELVGSEWRVTFRRLMAAGLPGWAGQQHERNAARLADTLARLEQGSFPRPPARVLELGCGNGMSWTRLMARRGYDLQGIDISETAIAWAEERFAEMGLSGGFRQGSVCEMPWFDEKSFDIVIDGSCLHCLIGNDRSRCLQAVRRILRTEGVFVVSSMCGLPKSDDARASFDPRTGHLLRDGQPYRTLKPLDDLVRELTDAGFDVQDTKLNINPWWDHVTMTCRNSSFPLPLAGEGAERGEAGGGSISE